jgi:hypothetical protein
MTLAASSPGTWIPERLITVAGVARCRWVDIADLRYTDPFFQSTLSRRPRDGRDGWLTPIEELTARAALARPVVPDAIVLHVSRCGSTLLSQLFSLDPGATVLSEVPLLDQILRSGRIDRELMFEAALGLIARPRHGETRLMVKADCWQIFDVDVLRRLYPHTPFILMYRTPVEVLASHQRMRGSHMVPGVLAGAPFHVPYDGGADFDRYGADVLRLHYEAMLRIAVRDPRTLLVNYEEGFPVVFLRVAKWLGLTFDDRHLQRICARCVHHGKRPHEAFAADSPARLPHVDLEPLDCVYAALERCRANQVSVA